MSEECTWPSHLPAVIEVRQWISSVLPGQPEISDPILIYAASDTPPDVRVTARFQVLRTAGSDLSDVVLKANYFPLLSSSARFHAFLSQHCAGVVPEVLASQETEKGSFLLYRPFEGEVVDQTRSLEALKETARTLARIQSAVAEVSEAEKAELPLLPVEQIPVLFGEMLAQIRTLYSSVWAADDGTMSQWMPFPASDVLSNLEPMQEQVESWSRELATGAYPTTVCHGDLHAGNAVIQPNGKVLIYDWDDAVLSCPFLAAERLLVSAWHLDEGKGGGPWGYRAGTSSQSLVREAYLEELSWGILPERRRAFTLAMCLAVIKEMHHEWTWAEMMGWKDGNPEWTAQLIGRLFQHIQEVKNA